MKLKNTASKKTKGVHYKSRWIIGILALDRYIDYLYEDVFMEDYDQDKNLRLLNNLKMKCH